MQRNKSCELALGVLLLLGAPLFADSSIIVPSDIAVGHNLETYASLKLSQPAPADGVVVTVTSDDPSRLLFSHTPEEKGVPSITLKVNFQYLNTPEFVIQGFGDSGFAGYSVAARGYGSTKGSVTLAPSGLLITGPFRSSEFKTTPRTAGRISVVSFLLNEAHEPVSEQPLAGGLALEVPFTTSNAHVGAMSAAGKLLGGQTTTRAEFSPRSAGSTVIACNPPSGFTTPSKLAAVTVTVELPGIGITGDLHLGKDLQIGGYVLLGEPAPADGVDVTITADNPQKMILSAAKDQVGTKSITLHVKGGESRAQYFVQGLADSGIVNYTAAASGYRTRTAPIGLTPSGVMVVYAPHEAPDEAEYLRATLTRDPRPFVASLSDQKPIYLAVWTVFLDAETHRGADMTAQPLRAGVKAKVQLENSNPAVAEVVSSLVIDGTSDHVLTKFQPRSVGQTTISVRAPEGFTAPSNATSVTATIKE